jgi:O-methyltransferase involved in polyketide biosynthesis
MKERTASATAGMVAAHRALESRRAVDRRICFDPFAEQFISPQVPDTGVRYRSRRGAVSRLKAAAGASSGSDHHIARSPSCRSTATLFKALDKSQSFGQVTALRCS